ncbi:MAG: PaREP1 family protein [bacterium]
MRKGNNNNVHRYIEQAERHLQQGEKEFEGGDLRQAGEKYWGSATQMLKAWATSKGIRHNGHAWLFEAASKLSSEENEIALKEAFILASALHTNFYEGWLTKDEVEVAALKSKAFCKRIKEILVSVQPLNR